MDPPRDASRGWGYLYFSKLNLRHAHGPWYNPVNALWLSPNEKGDYLYGGDDPGDNAVNKVWTLLREAQTQILEGALYQGARNNVDAVALALYAAPPSRAAYERLGEVVEGLVPKTPAFRAGRVIGSAFTTIQGLGEIGTGWTIWTGGTAASCILGGPPTGMVACVVGGGTSTAVGVPILVDGLGVTATSIGNGMQNVVSLFKGGGGGPSAAGPSGGGRQIRFDDSSQVQHEFKHAGDFGVTGTWNKTNGQRFVDALRSHVNGANTRTIPGTFRGTNAVIHYFDPATQLDVMVDPSGNFIASWKLDADQIKYLLANGNVQ